MNDAEQEARDTLRLLPCPFCGAGTTEFHDNGRMWTGQRMGRDREAAIAAWNRRRA